MANESIRLRTVPGSSKNIRFKLEQDFDFLEVLSIKISQEDLYQTFCANYGVVVGRVIANKGFGVPNSKISIFIPITSEDEKNVLIKNFYPFKKPNDKDSEGFRYNLLMSKASCELNTPVGNFPSKEELLDNEIVLEIFEKYYKYTTKTNSSGDFMLFGVPVGDHTIHMDIDISDAGLASVRPYDLIADGVPEKNFLSKTKFKSSTNLDTLPQIKTVNQAVTVIPFWGDEETCEVGITRLDIDTGLNIKTSSLFFGAVFTDVNKKFINKGCNPDNDQGEHDELKTGDGKIKIIRASDYDPIEWKNNGNIVPIKLENFDIDDGELIDQDGNFSFVLPCNLGHVITDEFGELVPSADPLIGLATKSMYRFAMKMGKTNPKAKFRTATMLFPSLGKDFEGTSGMVDTGSIVNANGTQDQRFTTDISQYDKNFYPNSRIELDFHTFEWKQVYTIAHYIKKYKKGANRFSFIGLKNVDIDGGKNPLPYNNAIWKWDVLYYIIIAFIGLKYTFIKFILKLKSFCIRFCIVLRISWGVTIFKKYIGFDITLLDICFQICLFSWLKTDPFDLPCEKAPNESYTIPPNGDWTVCNPDFCGKFVCTCNSNTCNFNVLNTGFAKIGLDTTGLDSDSDCLKTLDDWRCCVKYTTAENRNVIRRVFTDSWLFGSAYFFQFKYKRKVKKSGNNAGLLKKEKFCGPGSSTTRSDNYQKNKCCVDTDAFGSTCTRCLVRGSTKTIGNQNYSDYHQQNHNVAVEEKKIGSVDLDDIIYCNALHSTKIVSLGSTQMCADALEEIRLASLVNKGIKQYNQTFNSSVYDNGWDFNTWVNFLDGTSYQDPAQVIIYLAKNHGGSNCDLDSIFYGSVGNIPCHEREIKDEPFFYMKEVCKIYNDVVLSDGITAPTDEDEFNPLNGTDIAASYSNNPYASFNPDGSEQLNGGFEVDLDLANKFSPCGGNSSAQRCQGLPNNSNWKNYNNPDFPENADSNESWDRIIERGQRNNKNTRTNNPYYYFGITPGKTAIDKLRREFFVG
jgi:hypothetical protein